MAVPSEVKSIDRKTKTVQLEDGRTLPLPEDLAFEFLGSAAAKEKKKGMSEAVKSVQGLTENLPLGGEIGAFASSAGESSIFPKLAQNFLDNAGELIPSIKTGEGQEGMGFFERLGENVSALRAGRREAKDEIAQKYPKSSIGGTIAGIGADLALPLPKGLPKNPIAQGAALGGLYSAGSDTSVFQDPLKVAGEIGAGGAIGAGIGAVGSRLEKVAQDRAALRNYPELLQKHKDATTKAEKQFLTEMARKLDSVQSELRGAGIAREALAVDEFINREIGTSALAGTPQAKGLANFFESLQKSAPEHLNSGELKNLFNAIEGRLANAAAEEVPILNSFRQHLVDVIPQGAANTAVKHKYGTRLLNSFEKEVDTAVNSFMSDKKMLQDLKKFVGDKPLDGLAADIKRFVKSGYDKISPAEFTKDLTSGNFKDRLMWFFDNNQKLNELTTKIDGTLQNLQNIAPIAQLRSPEIQNLLKARDKLYQMRSAIERKMLNNIQSNSLAAELYEKDVAHKVGSKISNAVGVSKSSRVPTNARPVPTPPPGAPQVGKTAEFFETPNFYRTNLGRLAKGAKSAPGALGIGALGYAIGAPKLATAAGVGAIGGGLTALLRGATSPTALGAFAREGIQRGGIRMVVESIADKYPSYRNGILTDPQDRRAAAAEIEQDQDINLEDKAVLQARINRGLNIETLIQDEEEL